jgi:hypothetical protein
MPAWSQRRLSTHGVPFHIATPATPGVPSDESALTGAAEDLPCLEENIAA